MFAFLKIPDRLLPVAAPMFLTIILIDLACSAFFTLYGQKDNSWSLDPRWISQASYQAILKSTATTYETSEGQRWIVPSDPSERAKLSGTFQLTTPDGRWRGSIASNLNNYRFMAWFSAAVPVFSTALVGLFFTWPRRGKPSADLGGAEFLPSPQLQPA